MPAGRRRAPPLRAWIAVGAVSASPQLVQPLPAPECSFGERPRQLPYNFQQWTVSCFQRDNNLMGNDRRAAHVLDVLQRVPVF